jgi:hypothetical protein
MRLSQRADRHRTHGFAWLRVVPVLAYLMLSSLARAAPQAPGVEEFAPDTAVHPDRQQLETIIRQRYPQLVTQRFAGVPVVIVLLNHDGTLAATDLEIGPTDPDKLTVSRQHFSRFGLKARDLSYIGVARVELPLNTVLVMFGGRSTSAPERVGARGIERETAPVMPWQKKANGGNYPLDRPACAPS